MIRTRLFILLSGFMFWFGLGKSAAAQDMMAPVNCSLPLVDMPFNTQAHAWPSMQQSLGLTDCFYGVLHESVARGMASQFMRGRREFLTSMAILAVDIPTFYIPLGNSWLHEEWHRAVMAVHGISSYDEVNDFPFGSPIIQVSHVKDEDLVRLKQNSNSDLVRLAEAGVESQLESNVDIEKRIFFQYNSAPHSLILLMNAVNGVGYIISGSSKEADTIKRDYNRRQHKQQERDFVGHDFTSWVYDLNRPDEPYSARGVHPLGDGYNRYRGKSDLNSFERHYLSYQGTMSLLNLIDPFFLGIFQMPSIVSPGYMNGGLHHYLTSFGSDIGGRLYYMPQIDQKWFGRLHIYQNAYRSFLGLEAERIDMSLTPYFGLGVRVMGWQQPAEQAFRTREAATGGMGSVRLNYRRGGVWTPYAEVEGKTEGWVAGNPYLGRNTGLRLGINATIL